MSNKLVNTKNQNKIVIDDGSKIYTIENKQGKKLGSFEFRPSDTNIVNRYEEVVNFFNSFQFSGDTDDDRKSSEKEIVDKISYLIGSDAETAFFSILGAFSILASGELFVENVLNAIAKVIENELSVRMKKVQRRMNKYTTKYHK